MIFRRTSRVKIDLCTATLEIGDDAETAALVGPVAVRIGAVKALRCNAPRIFLLPLLLRPSFIYFGECVGIILAFCNEERALLPNPTKSVRLLKLLPH